MDFSLQIITPRGIYLTEEVSSLTVKLTTGYRTFLARHTDLIGSLDYAPMHIVKNGETISYAIHGGAINVHNGKITIICNAIENAKEIDEERARASKDRAEKRLNEKTPDINVARAELALKRALARLKALELN